MFLDEIDEYLAKLAHQDKVVHFMLGLSQAEEWAIVAALWYGTESQRCCRPRPPITVDGLLQICREESMLLATFVRCNLQGDSAKRGVISARVGSKQLPEEIAARHDDSPPLALGMYVCRCLDDGASPGRHRRVIGLIGFALETTVIDKPGQV
jgi:hypothetical protein